MQYNLQELHRAVICYLPNPRYRWPATGKPSSHFRMSSTISTVSTTCLLLYCTVVVTIYSTAALASTCSSFIKVIQVFYIQCLFLYYHTRNGFTFKIMHVPNLMEAVWYRLCCCFVLLFCGRFWKRNNSAQTRNPNSAIKKEAPGGTSSSS
jgi:hypothetical protein